MDRIPHKREMDGRDSRDSSVSVIIPAYNAEHSLREAIDGALSQTHAPLEIIVINDGSTDRTATVARRYERPDRLRRTSESRAGRSAKRRAEGGPRGPHRFSGCRRLLEACVLAELRGISAVPPGRDRREYGFDHPDVRRIGSGAPPAVLLRRSKAAGAVRAGPFL